MPKSVSERVAEHRRRQKADGLNSVSLVVPSEDVRFFRDLAATARMKARRRMTSYRRIEPPAQKIMPAPQLKLAERWAADSGLKIRLTKPGLKLAEVLARNIAHEIVREGWPVGRNLGSERQLQSRYGVGLKLLREAVRRLEVQSVAEMRRGLNGGLVVVEPTLESTTHLAGLYLEFRKIEGAHLKPTRRALQMLILERCMDNLDRAGRARLQALQKFEDELDVVAAPSYDFQRLHLILAQIGRDPVLELMMDLVLRLYRYHARINEARNDPSAPANVRRMHRDIIVAILSGNRARARQTMMRHLDYVDSWLA